MFPCGYFCEYCYFSVCSMGSLVCLSLYHLVCLILFFFFKQKTAYEMRISDWSSDVCSSDLAGEAAPIAGDRLQSSAAGAQKKVLFSRELCRYCDEPLRAGKIRFGAVLPALRRREIGRASCRERVCQYV